jgi:hypothetical protein
MVAEATLHPDYQPSRVDPEWRVALWNGMEQTGGNDEMRMYIRIEGTKGLGRTATRGRHDGGGDR